MVWPPDDTTVKMDHCANIQSHTWHASLLPQRPGIDHGPVHVEFMVNNMALEQVSVLVLWSVAFHKCSILIFHSPITDTRKPQQLNHHQTEHFPFYRPHSCTYFQTAEGKCTDYKYVYICSQCTLLCCRTGPSTALLPSWQSWNKAWPKWCWLHWCNPHQRQGTWEGGAWAATAHR